MSVCNQHYNKNKLDKKTASNVGRQCQQLVSPVSCNTWATTVCHFVNLGMQFYVIFYKK